MKKIKNKIQNIALIVALFGSVSLTSCSNWLDVKPSNQTSATQLFSSEKGFQEALTGAYSLMTKPELYGRDMTFGLVDAVGQQWKYSSSNTTFTYFYPQKNSYTESQSMTLIDNVWKKQYNVIANVNDILAFVDTQKRVFASEANYSVIKGEALALRAFLHFDMLRLFAPYDVNKAEVKKWIPYVDEFSINTSLSLTFDETITKILGDLSAAEQLLKSDPIFTGVANADTYYKNRNWHINYYALKAIQARVYLYAGMKSEALVAAKEVIGAQQTKKLFPFVTREAVSSSDLAKRDRTFSSEHLFALNIRNLSDYTDTYFIKVGEKTALVQNIGSAKLYEGISEYRSQFFETESGVVDVLSKFWQLEKASVDIKFRMPLLRVSEVYYIAAETETNPIQAQEYLNQVRRARGISADLIGNLTPETLLPEIRKEYDKEFVGEGQIFYFHKRMGTIKIANVNANYQFPMPEDEINFGGRPRPEGSIK